MLIASATLGTLEWLPAHELAAAKLVNTRVACNAEQPRLDFERNRWPPVPGALRFFPGGQGQVVTIVGITHQALDLTKHGGVVRRKRVLDQ